MTLNLFRRKTEKKSSLIKNRENAAENNGSSHNVVCAMCVSHAFPLQLPLNLFNYAMLGKVRDCLLVKFAMSEINVGET